MLSDKDVPLHFNEKVTDGVTRLRVDHGWIYTFAIVSPAGVVAISTQFVPDMPPELEMFDDLMGAN